MRTNHALKSSEKGASSRAIEAAVRAYLCDPLARPNPLLPDTMTEALLALIDGAKDAQDLAEALDCAADDPRLQETASIPLRPLEDELWHVGHTTIICREHVRHAIGAKAASKLEEVAVMLQDLSRAAADLFGDEIRKTQHLPRPKAVVFDPSVPTELNQALARFHMALVAELCLVAASNSRRKRVPSAIGMALVNTIEQGLCAFMPWLLLAPAVSFSAETRAKLPRLEFDSIFERHFEQMAALNEAFPIVEKSPTKRR